MPTGVFIDGGYLTKVIRLCGGHHIDYHRLAVWACQGDNHFRTYYYDCLPYQSSLATDEERRRISDKQKFFSALDRGPRTIVRLGTLVYRGTDDSGSPIFVQKKVDLLIGLDISTLVLKNRVSNIALLTGDSDFIPAVEMARREGIIVRLVHGPTRSYHQDLWNAVDERLEITAEVLEGLRR